VNYGTLALELLEAIQPKEKRRPPTELEAHEHVKDGTIRYLFEHDCVATPAQLTEFFGFSQARLTKILSELEADGLVMRQNDSADRRRVIVHLTDKGLMEAGAKHLAKIERMVLMLEYLGEEDAMHLVRIMKKLQQSDLLTPGFCGSKERNES